MKIKGSCAVILVVILVGKTFSQSKDAISFSFGYAGRFPYTQADNNYYHKDISYVPGQQVSFVPQVTEAPAYYRNGGYGNGFSFRLKYKRALNEHNYLLFGAVYHRMPEDRYTWHDGGDYVNVKSLYITYFYDISTIAQYYGPTIGWGFRGDLGKHLTAICEVDLQVGIADKTSVYEQNYPAPVGNRIIDETNGNLGLGFDCLAGIGFDVSPKLSLNLGIFVSYFQARISQGHIYIVRSDEIVSDAKYTLQDVARFGAPRQRLFGGYMGEGAKYNIPFSSIGSFLQLEYRLK